MHGARTQTYHKAFRRGWQDAWREYLAEQDVPLAAEAGVEEITRATKRPLQLHTEPPEEPEPEVRLVLNPEWAAYFAKRRKLAGERAEEEAAEEAAQAEAAAAALDLGGGHDAARAARAERYGDRRDEVLRAEARLNAAFQLANHNAPYWPALPLPDWKLREQDGSGENSTDGRHRRDEHQ